MVKNVTYNGNEVKKIVYNGVVVWQKQTLITTSETTDAQALLRKARVTINHTLSHTPVSVTSVSGTKASVTSWSVSGNVVTLTLYNTGTSAVLAYATITYTYYG